MNWNYDSLTGQVRAIAPAIITWLTAQGINLNWWEQALLIIGVTGGCCVWSYFNNRPGKIISSSITGIPKAANQK